VQHSQQWHHHLQQDVTPNHFGKWKIIPSIHIHTQVWVASAYALQASKQVQYTLMLLTWPSALACLMPGDLPLYKRHMGHLARGTWDTGHQEAHGTPCKQPGQQHTCIHSCCSVSGPAARRLYRSPPWQAWNTKYRLSLSSVVYDNLTTPGTLEDQSSVFVRPSKVMIAEIACIGKPKQALSKGD
jgi:hypothetical protein